MKKQILILIQVLAVFGLLFLLSCNKDKKEDENISIGKSYQGGKIFYIDDTGKHGLIAAPSDEIGRYTWDEAISVCDSKVLDGYSDWYLPSKNELYELYLKKGSVGGFSQEYYWSSSEDSTDSAWYQYFINGVQGNDYYARKDDTFRVRAIRAF